jgi:oligopeptidase B
MRPPVAKRVPRVVHRHGRAVADDYGWMRERDDPDVRAYLEAENAYAAQAMAATRPLRERLYAEILGRIRETDRSVPEPDGPYRYYRRTVAGCPYAIHCRVPEGSEAEEVLLDENALAAGCDYFRLGALEIGPDHGLLAYAYDETGEERYTLRFLDLRAGRLLDESIANAGDSLAWAADGRSVLYVTLDAAHRPHRAWRHVLDSDPATDRLVYEEPDAAFFLGVARTKDRRRLLLCLGSNTTSEVRWLDAADPAGEPRVVLPRQHRVEYAVEHHGDRWLILTNAEARDFRLVETPCADPAPERWRELVPHRPGIRLEQFDVFRRHLAVVERERGTLGIRIVDLESRDQHVVDFPEPVHTVALHANPQFDSERLRFTYTSLVTPASVFEYDMRRRGRERLKQEEVVGGYDPARYRSERLTVRAADGAEIPVSLVYGAERERTSGTRPLLLYGYGAYGASVDPVFDAARLSLLDRGVAWAIAHVRGGGELGRAWYEAGKLEHKPNTFHDFVACAEQLVREGWTTPAGLAIHGASAGGLLVGAACNLRPGLFRAAVAQVPFVDVVNTMLDDSLPLTVIEREEWGDPRRAEDHARMRAWSPYDNVRAVDYPHLLILGGLNDPRVAFWEPAKWAARLRALKTDTHLLLLKTDLAAGHGGPSGRYARIRERAFEYAFLLDRLGVPA